MAVEAVDLAGAVPPIATLILLRVKGSRKVDVVPTDRTAVPTLSDEGNRLVDAMDGIWGSTRPNGPRCGLRAAHSHGSVVTGRWESTYGADDPERAERLGVPLFAEPQQRQGRRPVLELQRRDHPR